MALQQLATDFTDSTELGNPCSSVSNFFVLPRALLDELRKQSGQRSTDRTVRLKTVAVDILQVGRHLKGVPGAQTTVEIRKRRAQRSISRFGLNQQPWFSIACYQEIHFPLCLIANKKKIVLSEPAVGPSKRRFMS
jgi:hypothetical protein